KPHGGRGKFSILALQEIMLVLAAELTGFLTWRILSVVVCARGAAGRWRRRGWVGPAGTPTILISRRISACTGAASIVSARRIRLSGGISATACILSTRGSVVTFTASISTTVVCFGSRVS